MDSRLLRILYAIEFFLALIAVYTVWREVGGSGHLDLIAWQWKLTLGAGLSFASVQATAGAFGGEHAVNRRSVGWSVAALLLIATMGGLTYYHHLHEDAETDPEVTIEET
ncbi:MAG: hypothetical protein ACRD96_07305 [Bryobacteraceae bacterium]